MFEPCAREAERVGGIVSLDVPRRCRAKNRQ